MNITERIEYERHINEVFSEAKRIALKLDKRVAYESLDETWLFLCRCLNNEYKEISK
jgi:hypothetical protein